MTEQGASLLERTKQASWDRKARVVAGLAILSLSVWGPHSAWALLGLAPLITGVLNVCPICAVVDIGVCPAKRTQA